MNSFYLVWLRRPLIVGIAAILLVFSSSSEAFASDDAMVASYTTAWKSLLAETSGISTSDLEKLVLVKKAEISSWNSGKTFSVSFGVKIGWLTSERTDRFMVWLNQSEDAYRGLPLPRDTWFSLPELRIVLEKRVFNTTVAKIDPTAKPLFADLEEAKAFILKKHKLSKLDEANVAFYVPGKVPREDGAPYLIWSSVIDERANKCLEGYLNLVTGADEAHENAIRFYGSHSGRGVVGPHHGGAQGRGIEPGD